MKRSALTLSFPLGALGVVGVVMMAIVAVASAANAATVTVDFFDGGDGFHSQLPADPVSTAPGATLGEQRRASFEAAAAEWGARLISNVEIVVEADMVPLSCNSGSALLGSAGPETVETGWAPGAGGNAPEFPATWYHSALANKIANTDLAPGRSDVGATFNSALDDNDSCLNGTNWFYSIAPAPSPPGSR